MIGRYQDLAIIGLYVAENSGGMAAFDN